MEAISLSLSPPFFVVSLKKMADVWEKETKLRVPEYERDVWIDVLLSKNKASLHVRLKDSLEFEPYLHVSEYL